MKTFIICIIIAFIFSTLTYAGPMLDRGPPPKKSNPTEQERILNEYIEEQIKIGKEKHKQNPKKWCGCGCGMPTLKGKTHCGCGWKPDKKGI